MRWSLLREPAPTRSRVATLRRTGAHSRAHRESRDNYTSKRRRQTNVASRNKHPTQCYIDESVQATSGFVVSAFVFASGRFDQEVAAVLRKAGLKPHQHEFKSSARMDSNPQMREARQGLMQLAQANTRIGVFFGPYQRAALSKHSLQALQSILVRNGIRAVLAGRVFR